MKKILYTIIFCLICSPLFGATYHIKQSATGDESGSSEANADSVAAFNADTINDGATGMAAGDTVYFSGTITTPIVPPVSGSSGGGAITLDGYATDDNCDPIADCDDDGNCSNEIGSAAFLNPSNDRAMYIHGGVDYITVQDFRMTGGGTDKTVFQINNSTEAGISDHITAKRNYIYRSAYALFSSSRDSNRVGSEYITVEGNKMVNYGYPSNNQAEGVRFHYTHEYVVRGNEFGIGSASCTSDNVIGVYNTYNGLIEYNESYGANNQTALAIKENGSQDIIVRFNKFHDSGGGSQGRCVGINWPTTARIYFYGNFLYNTSQSGEVYVMDVFDGATYLYIWSNIFVGGTQQGFMQWWGSGRAPGDPHIDNLYFYNNTVVYGASDHADATKVGLNLSDDSSTNNYVKNNIFYNNRVGSSSGYQQTKYDMEDFSKLYTGNNTYFFTGRSSADDMVYCGDTSQCGSIETKTLAEMQALANPQEIDSEFADPKFTDPAGTDTNIGTEDDDYTQTEAGTTGEDLTQQFQLNIQGTTYTMNLNQGLDPATDWTVFPSSATVKSKTRTVWDRGAYVFTTTPDEAPTIDSIQTEDASCPSSPVNINHGAVTNKAAYCRQSLTEQTYDVMTSAKQMTGGEGTIYHWSPRETACGQTVCYWTACSTSADDSGYESDPVEICRTILAAPLIASQQGITGAGNVSITGTGNVGIK